MSEIVWHQLHYIFPEMDESLDKLDDEKEDKRKELFSQQMRAATRNIHNTSDALVNAKLGVTMSDDSVWAEGWFQFFAYQYCIYNF